MFLLQFILGIRDSLLFTNSIKRYLYPNKIISNLQLLKILLNQEIVNDPPESELIAQKTFESMKLALQFLGIMILYYIIKNIAELIIGDILSTIIYFAFVFGTYSTYAAGMWMRTQSVTQEAIKMEMNYYLNPSFVGYQIDEAAPLQALEHMMTRIIFSILFQLQSNIICFIIGNYLPLPLSLLTIPIYSLFISIQNTSAKIPYKPHLARYYTQNISYLIGLNFLFSLYLHVSQFPFFTGLLWFIMPLYLLNAVPREPPSFELKTNLTYIQYFELCLNVIKQGENQNNIVIKRNSYVIHLEKYFDKNDQEYATLCDQSITYVSLSTTLVPYVQNLLSKIISLLGGHEKND